MITLSVQEAIDTKLRSILGDIVTLKKDNILLHTEVGKLQSVVSTLRQSERDFAAKLDALEAYQRSDNVVVRGLTESMYAEVGSLSAGKDDDEMIRSETVVAAEETFLKFCNVRLHVKLTSSDISTAHRLPESSNDKARLLIIRFTNRRSRDLVLRAKKILRTDPGERIFLSEQLTKMVSNIFYEARKQVKEKKLFATWTTNGQVFIKKTSDTNERPLFIMNVEDLLK